LEINWNQIRIFYNVAKAGSISLGAQRLNLTPSAITKSIQELEARIKTKLFLRHAKGVTLTGNGKKFYDHAIKMYSSYEDIQACIITETKYTTEKLKIITTTGLATQWLIDYLINFSKSYPKIKLSVFGTDDNIELKEGYFDIAITNKILNQDDFEQEYFTTFHTILYASKGYVDHYGLPKKPEDLNKHKLISFGNEESHPYGHINWHLTAGAKKGYVRKTVLEFNSSIGLVKAAENDLGIIAMPKNHPLLKNTNLIPILPDYLGEIGESYFTYHKNLKNIDKVKIFINYIKENFKFSEH